MTAQPLADREFILARFDEYLNDMLSGSDAERFRRLMQQESLAAEQTIEETKRAIGMFQLGLQSYFLNEDQRAKLQNLAEDPEQRKTREVQRIQDIGKWEAFADFRRRIVMFLLVSSAILGLIYYFTPERPQTFDALQTLVFEAATMDERGIGKLDLPTVDENEVNAFIAAYRGLDFEAIPLGAPGEDWFTQGATVIDYEPRRIIAVVYESKVNQQRMYYFNFSGSVSDLAKAEKIIEGNTTFFPYANETYNIVCWQASKDSVGMLMGRQSAKELARLAAK